MKIWLDLELKQDIVHTLIQKIIVHEDKNQFEIVWNF